MPICIECRYPVPQLYHVLHSRNSKSAATTPSNTSQNPSHKSSTSNLASHSASAKQAPVSPRRVPPAAQAKKASTVGSDVRLTQCPRCKRFADKYVEHDYVVIFIDLVLVKPQVYRHILFNRFSHDAPQLDPAIRRLGTLLLLFDVYLTMIHIESPTSPASRISDFNALVQWCFFVLVCGAATLSQHLLIRWLAGLLGLCGAERDFEASERTDGMNGLATPTPGASAIEPPKAPTPSAISTALFVSSCMSLFPVLMIVWSPDESTSSASPASVASKMSFLPSILVSPGRGLSWVRSGVNWVVAVQNIEALRILLGCGYSTATGLVFAGSALAWTIRSFLLGVVLEAK